MTYNVHRCIGRDRALSPRRIAKVIQAYEPDVVALQELDVGRQRTQHGDQPDLIAKEVQMKYFFHPALRAADEHYGDAILSRHPMELVRADVLPTLPGHARLERRGALWVAINIGGRSIQVINTHLGLRRLERLAQTEALLGSDWLGHPGCAEPKVLCGDLNAQPGSLVYRRIRGKLRDAQHREPASSRHRTWPAYFPCLRLDYVFVSRDLHIHRTAVPRTALTRIASDHLPVIAEVSFA